MTTLMTLFVVIVSLIATALSFLVFDAWLDERSKR